MGWIQASTVRMQGSFGMQFPIIIPVRTDGALEPMASTGVSEGRESYAGSMQDLRESLRRFSKILVKSFLDYARRRGSDPVELYRLGKLVLESIKLRRSLLERRRGPKWSEEEELRRMERQVWKVMSGLEKRPHKGLSELTRFSKELRRIMEDYGKSRGKSAVWKS